MMDSLRQYAMTVVSGAVICSVLLNMVQCSSHRQRIRLLCGLCLGILILGPLRKGDWHRIPDLTSVVFSNVQDPAAAGEEMARKAAAKIISERVQAYILDKAAMADTDLTVRVSVGEDLLPIAAQLHGPITDEMREILSGILEEDLGISKENQRWTG